MKAFQVEPEFCARVGAHWYRQGEILRVAEDDQVEVHLAHPIVCHASCLGVYLHAELDTERPPFGLRRMRQP
jgi:hypothetical protein